MSQLPASNLPSEMTSFIGRRTELAQAKKLLSGSRLLTLVGPGGVGKTRLALRFAGDVRRAFPDGVWVAELADLRNPSLLPHTIAAVLGLQDGSTTWTLHTLAAYVQDKRMLLVLDNCEHLVEDCATFARGLLARAPELQILATSRESLKAPGEQVLSVPPLSAPPDDAGAHSGDLLHYESVELFVARANARLPGFALDGQTRDDVARICHALDGIPLAIELAADRVRSMSPRQILDRLTSRLALLTQGSRGVPTRQQTLRASIAWSHDLCSEAERTLWARLSVFTGGFELDAAEGVCAGSDLVREHVADLLSALLEKSILTREERGAYVRYRMLETIREYGYDSLAAAGESDELKARHRSWYANLVREAYDEWVGPNQAEWLNRLRMEHSNIRAALQSCLADPAGADDALRIGAWLVHYWIVRGLLSEGRHWLGQALAHTDHPSEARVAAMRVAAYLAAFQYDYPASDALLDEARETLAEVDTPSERSYVDFVAATSSMFVNEWDQAFELFERALAGFRDCKDLEGEIWTLVVLGLAGAVAGDHERATTSLEQCLRVTQERSESWFRSYALLALGIDAWAQSDHARANSLLQESLTLGKPLEDRLGRAFCYEILAWVAAGESHDDRAATLLGVADAGWQDAGTTLRAWARLDDLHHRCQAELRKRLRDKAFDALRERGRVLSAVEALAFALGEETKPSEERGGDSLFAPLTHREWQIAGAVAEGLSNRQIATRFVIAQRTAEGHVEHILTKLGFNSRAQIAAWAAERLSRAGR